MENILTYSGGAEEIQFDKIYNYIKVFKKKYQLTNISSFRLTKIIIKDILIENITTNKLNLFTNT